MRTSGILAAFLGTLIFSQAMALGPEETVNYEEWIMSEEWYDWHHSSEFEKRDDGSLAVECHFVGPGADIPRNVYIRVPKDADWTKVHAELPNHHGKALQVELVPLDAVGAPADRQWYQLGKNNYVRGFSDLILRAPGGVPAFDYALVSPNERYITHGRAERFLADYEAAGRDFSKVIRCGLPLGGAGAGKVEIARDGSFRNLTINNNLDSPIYHPEGCFMALSADGEARTLRAWAGAGMAPVQSIEMEGRYPAARLRFSEDGFPVTADLTAWSPIIPYDLKHSTMPAALLEFALTNHFNKPVTAAVAVSWENLLGISGRAKGIQYLRTRQLDGNTQAAFETPAMAGLRFSSGDKKDPDSIGNYTLAAAKAPNTEVSVLAGYDPENPGEAWAGFAKDGAFVDGANAEGPSAAIAIRVQLMPGETVTIPVVFAWFMDHQHQQGAEDMGHYYHNYFADSAEVAAYALGRRDALRTDALALERAFEASTLPDWLVDSLLNDAYVFSTDTYVARDGRFTVNEGATNMYGVAGTLDQKLFAAQYYANFFPYFQKRELLEFARLQNANGWLTHDVGQGQFAKRLNAYDWPDLNCSFIILSWQMLQTTGDLAFWSAIKDYVDHAIEALATTFTLFETRPYHGRINPGGGSTFDDEDSYPLFSYHAGLYLCVLRIGQDMARMDGDAERVGVLEERFRLARIEAMHHLYNGKYFVYGADIHKGERSTSSHFSQLAGDFFSGLLGMGDLFEPEVRDSALDSLLTMHGNPKFALPPKIVTEDGELFPRSGPHRAAPVSWPLHSRPLLSGNAFFYGREQEGWDLLKRIHDNYRKANGPDPWDQSLYYDPLTGRLDWGIFYMTAPASWLAYEALAGVEYDFLSRAFRIRPAIRRIDPNAVVPIFSPACWSTLEIDGGREWRLTVNRIPSGVLILEQLTVDEAERVAEVVIDGQAVAVERDGGVLRFAKPVRITEGARITIRF